jgi:hypothetical protein
MATNLLLRLPDWILSQLAARFSTSLAKPGELPTSNTLLEMCVPTGTRSVTAEPYIDGAPSMEVVGVVASPLAERTRQPSKVCVDA